MLKDLSNENIIHIEKNGTQYIQFRKLLEYSDIISHAYSIGTNVNFRTKINYQEEEKLNTLKDYKNLCKAINIKYENIVKPIQMHTDNVKIVDYKINKEKPDINLDEYFNVDGLITNKKNLILSTTNADCTLLLIFDPITKTIANIHSGWRGTVNRIAEKSIKKMIEKFSCKPENIICCICPSIRSCHFEVRKDVEEIFTEEFKNLKGIEKIITKCRNSDEEKWTIDLIQINKQILVDIGLKPQNIIDSKICSVCNSDVIHSYRATKKGFGQETALITLI